MNKTVKITILALVLAFCDVGANSPIRSEISSGTNINAEIKQETDKYIKMYEEIYEKSLIQEIEFESEMIIPDCIIFKDIEYVYKLTNKIGFSVRSVFRLIYKESSFDSTKVSPMGARGLMQLMPGTRATYAEMLRIDTLHLNRNQEDIYIGLTYLMDLHTYWVERGNSEKYSWRLALASYNAGKGTVIKYKGIPPYKETNDFIGFILRIHSNPAFYANILQKTGKQSKVTS
jgi:Transglycosylase SLT domain